MGVDENQLQQRFLEFDKDYFGDQLHDGTEVRLQPELAGGDYEDGNCRKDGGLINISPAQDHDWEATLIHEMVHAFECRFPGRIHASPEGIKTKELHPKFLFGSHSAEFFTKLLDVMRRRSHPPESHWQFYFG